MPDLTTRSRHDPRRFAGADAGDDRGGHRRLHPPAVPARRDGGAGPRGPRLLRGRHRCRRRRVLLHGVGSVGGAGPAGGTGRWDPGSAIRGVVGGGGAAAGRRGRPVAAGPHRGAGLRRRGQRPGPAGRQPRHRPWAAREPSGNRVCREAVGHSLRHVPRRAGRAGTRPDRRLAMGLRGGRGPGRGGGVPRAGRTPRRWRGAGRPGRERHRGAPAVADHGRSRRRGRPRRRGGGDPRVVPGERRCRCRPVRRYGRSGAQRRQRARHRLPPAGRGTGRPPLRRPSPRRRAHAHPGGVRLPAVRRRPAGRVPRRAAAGVRCRVGLARPVQPRDRARQPRLAGGGDRRHPDRHVPRGRPGPPLVRPRRRQLSFAWSWWLAALTSWSAAAAIWTGRAMLHRNGATAVAGRR